MSARPDDDVLPGRDDPWWDEVTQDALARLAVLRRAGLRRRRRETAYVLYVVLLFGLFYAVPYASAAVRVSDGPREPWASWLAAGAPAGATALALGALVLAAADGRWRGPVLLDAASAHWLLPTAVRRGALLRPRWRLAVALYAALGAALAAAAAFVLRVVCVGALGWTLLPAAGAGAALGALAAAAGLAAQRDRVPPAALRLRWVAVALGGLAAATAAGSVPGPVGAVLLWSGPWGWAAQPLVLSAGAGVPGWPLGLALLAAAAAAAAVLGDRAAGGVPSAALRRRARAVDDVVAAATVLDLRLARQLTRTADGVPARRLPAPPRRARLAVAWRTLVGWRRDPARPAWAAVLLATALGLVEVSSAATGAARAVLLLGALLAGYGAAAQLVEGARLEADDTTRSRVLPLRFRTLVLRHGEVPALALTAGGALAAGVLTALGGAAQGAWLLVLGLPALVLAALVSACRGPVPPHLFLGPDTGAGSVGPLRVLAWTWRAPLAALAGLAPVLLVPQLVAAPVPVPAVLGWAAAVTAALGWWARQQAGAHHRA
ncbi:DUF6297 family protein [Vallicoccus soli]|uniref:Uncharacterized protein n=1 Tax=Vallicoccus soli TaxID=2339232 RepID=A0A3A3YPY9_9ACTN|nr:DUF6297 family protein [Vallicoccus soli]RJK92773.1 hypothetical protein D5H78_18105 [Vallicoccus soli]